MVAGSKIGAVSVQRGKNIGTAPPVSVQLATMRSRKKGKGGGRGGGAELCLDWDRSYLAPMKYCLKFKEETSTP